MNRFHANVVIREARVEDAPVLASAAREHAATPGKLASLPDELQDNAYAHKIGHLLAVPNGCFLVAAAEGRLVGHALLDPMGLSSVAHVVHLTIVVHPGFERRGFGRLLMHELLSWAHAAPAVEKVELRVREANERAIGLYRSLGFVEEGRHVRRIKTPDGTYFDDVAMALWVGKSISSN